MLQRAAKGGASTSARITLQATEFEPAAYETHAKQLEVSSPSLAVCLLLAEICACSGEGAG
jgi:hypothetical protein